MTSTQPPLSRRTLLLGAAGLSLPLSACATERPTGPASGPPSHPATPTPSPTATPPADPLPAGPFTVLLVGSDTWEDPRDGRPDVIVLAQLDAAREHLALVSLPRDAWVPIDGGREGKVNAAYGGDVARLQRTVSAVLGGLPIHGTALTGFAGYSAIVDALGHLEVDNTIESTFIDPTDGHPSHFPKGRLTLSTADWLVYARQRKELPRGDLDRTARHRAILTGMLRRAREVAATDPAAFAALVAAVWQHVETTGELTADRIAGLGRQVAGVGPDAVTSLMVPVAGTGNRGGQSVVLLDRPLVGELAAALASGDVAGYAAATSDNPRTR